MSTVTTLVIALTSGASDIVGSNSITNVRGGSKGVAANDITDVTNRGSGKLGVQPIDTEDNYPTPPNHKKPLEPPIGQDDEEVGSNYNSFLMSVSMIVVSEIGDKTFLIAALMAMRHSRYVVFSSAFLLLAIMTVLSGVVGHALPALLSRRITQFLASLLFVVFGYKLLNEGMQMSRDMGVEDELAEVEEEIALTEQNTELDDLESGGIANSTTAVKTSWYKDLGNQITNLLLFMLSPIWIQVFVMTFLGEWGDRSQIATIAMAAGSDYWFVILGAVVGHFLCTAAACIGGKLLAKKISMRNVTIGGSIAFFVFAILYFYSAWYDIE